MKALIAKPSETSIIPKTRRSRSGSRSTGGEWNLRPPFATWTKYRPILTRLQEDPRDFGKALLSIDRRMRAMVVFEFQSALWNDAVRRYLVKKVPERDSSRSGINWARSSSRAR